MMDVSKYKEMDCPVCGKFYFSALEPGDAELYDYMQCSSCGWKCDVDQTNNPDSFEGLNDVSLSEYRSKYENLIKDNPDYSYLDSIYEAEPHVCPICGKHTFSDNNSFEVCPICGWEDDSVMEENPDEWGGCSNDLPLNQFKQRYEKTK